MPHQAIKVHYIDPTDWRGLPNDIPHFGEETGIWLEVFDVDSNAICFTCGAELWLEYARFALEQPFLSCRLASCRSSSLNEPHPELFITMAQLFEREVSRSKYRADVFTQTLRDFENCDWGQWGTAFSKFLQGLCSDVQAIDDDFIRSQIVYFAVVLKQRIHALHTFSKGEKA